MLSRLILLFAITIPILAAGQVGMWPHNQRQMKKEYNNHDCREYHHYDAKERRKFFPYNEASRITIVSFPNEEDSIGFYQLPLIDGTIDSTKIKEHVILTEPQIDSLTHILHNFGYKGRIANLTGRGCYNPRNAILFYDAQNHLIAWIELCFECGCHRLSSEKIDMGDLCRDKYWHLQKLFYQCGILLGTVQGTMYPLSVSTGH